MSRRKHVKHSMTLQSCSRGTSGTVLEMREKVVKDGTLGKIKAAHRHDKEDSRRRNHGDIDLRHNHGKILYHPSFRQNIEDDKDNNQSDDRQKRADQRDVGLPPERLLP